MKYIVLNDEKRLINGIGNKIRLIISDGHTTHVHLNHTQHQIYTYKSISYSYVYSTSWKLVFNTIKCSVLENSNILQGFPFLFFYQRKSIMWCIHITTFQLGVLFWFFCKTACGVSVDISLCFVDMKDKLLPCHQTWLPQVWGKCYLNELPAP